MTYNEAKSYMEQVEKRGSILGLEAIQMLLERLDNPQDKLPVIHVAGTNGKGSICTFLESMYRAEGKRVGRYISPTLFCYLERFQINGKHMEEATFAHLMAKVIPILMDMENMGLALPTAFEIETVLAFLYFWEENVDLVILETGMGGRYDATNVVAKPLCTVFASIGMDHMQFLGETIEQIAYEKAGIIKKDCKVVSYPNSEVVLNVLQKEYSLHNIEMRDNDYCRQNTEFRVVASEDIQICSRTMRETVFRYKGQKYRIGMCGDYQVYNAATAIETKLLLDGTIESDSLHNVKWPGRFERISQKPDFIVDGAHNIDGVHALRESLQQYYQDAQFVFIMGVFRDKEYASMCDVLCPIATSVFTITPPTERGLDAEILKECASQYCNYVVACESIEMAVEQAMASASFLQHENVDLENVEEKPIVIVACGSLSFMGKIKEVVENGTSKSDFEAYALSAGTAKD